MRDIHERAKWFFETFGDPLQQIFSDTNITPDLVGAIALQETGYIWNSIWRSGAVAEDEFLACCVGDTISNRSYFPESYDELVGSPRGEELFVSLREVLRGMTDVRPRLSSYASREKSVLYGYGIFQYDLMFYKYDADYEFFIEKKWSDFSECAVRFKKVMLRNMRRRNFSTTQELDQDGKIMAALLYHRGKVRSGPLHRQGYCENDGRGPCYGEKIDRYLRISRQAINSLEGRSEDHERRSVVARSGLRLRSGPGDQFERILVVPYGDQVYVLSEGEGTPWVLVDLEGDGKADGYMHSSFLT